MGTIEIVIAAAGTVGEPFELFNKNERPSLEKDPLPPSRLDRVIDVNLKGLCFTSQLAHYFGLPSTFSENSSVWKSLTLIGSAISYSDYHTSPDYSASKWAAKGVFRAIRRLMEQQGYRVNLIAPGIIDTPLIGDLKDYFMKNGVPIGDPKDVAETVVRCAVDDAICGRAIANEAPKIFSLRDDPEGLDGGVEFKSYLQTELKTYGEFFLLL